MLDGIVLRLDTEEEYRAALRKLEAWMLEDDRPAPPHVESLIQALVRYEEIHFPMEWKT
jgi:hypothetical protein